eukprot:m.2063 g.2063  ORF g.2063 m.2063 type:complete len:115 (+) comp1708_c0_seq2:1460-1804(+)
MSHFLPHSIFTACPSLSNPAHTILDSTPFPEKMGSTNSIVTSNTFILLMYTFKRNGQVFLQRIIIKLYTLLCQETAPDSSVLLNVSTASSSYNSCCCNQQQITNQQRTNQQITT